MTTQIGAWVFVDPSEIRHSITDGNPTLTFGPYPTVNRVDVHLGDVACIDKVIAELVALRNEMEPHVIPAKPEGCPACETDCDDETVFCGKFAGHAGNHHAILGDGAEMAWPNPCGSRPYPAGSEGDDGTECMLPVGHEGPHDDAPAPAPESCGSLAPHSLRTCKQDKGHDGLCRDRELAWEPPAAAAPERETAGSVAL